MKWVIVTGGSRGLGQVIVKDLLKTTNYGVIAISRSENKDTKDIDANRYQQIQFDLAKPEMFKELYLQVIRKIGPIYGLVNNAAVAYDDIVTNLNMKKLEDMFAVNVFSSMVITKYAIRDMLLYKTKGSIIFISSVCAHTGYNGLSMYAASKGALEAFSKNIAREWGKSGIRSNCIAPGFMNTDMSSSLSEQQKRRIFERNALKSETLTSSVSKAVLYLVSEDSISTTGSVLHVDSGTI